ncbi:MAG: hypothetical protein IPP50_16745 [Piscinibacter sp.]|nr:hypothetical protein [Piscinibacter sp.]
MQRALAVTREMRPGDVRIVAYVVPQSAAPDSAELRQHLSTLLPDYMIPQHFVVLDSIPLLPNGKTDRRALPAPVLAASEAVRRTTPRTPTEQIVASAMESVLALPGLGDDDNFFQLGGHSLLATQLANSLGRSTGARVPLRAIFEAPTVTQLAAWLDARSASAMPATAATATPAAAPARAEADRAPLSLMQQRLWFLEQLEPGRVTYNTPSAHRLTGPLDVAALERALNEMVRRQPILRTALVADADGEPMPAHHARARALARADRGPLRPDRCRARGRAARAHEGAGGRAHRHRHRPDVPPRPVPTRPAGARAVLHAAPCDLGRLVVRPVLRGDGGDLRRVRGGPAALAPAAADHLRRLRRRPAAVAGQRRTARAGAALEAAPGGLARAAGLAGRPQPPAARFWRGQHAMAELLERNWSTRPGSSGGIPTPRCS